VKNNDWQNEGCMKKNAKVEKILDVALALLKTDGDYGVTMRQVAAHADMTLSNVQYYFKNKDSLLVAMADRYFHSCLEEMRAMPKFSSLQQLLKHGLALSEMCRIFREYWAISTRNASIEQYLDNYYRAYAQVLADMFRPVAVQDSNATIAASLFVPFVEGYSITALSLPENIDTISKEICALLRTTLLRKN
jgi:AcrR family transcriptional regulator